MRGDRNTTQARVARAALRALGGWRFVGEIPEPRKAVCLAVPHTDNLDGLLLVLLAQSAGMQISWMIKDTWGKGLMGRVVRGVGGVPIDRTRAHGMVGQMIDELAARDDFYLVIPPEGTRSRAAYWKSGFYHIALGAKVPVVPGFLCYQKKQGGFGPPIELTGDVRADMDRLRAFYAESAPVPRHPDKFGPIRLREEEAGSAS
ncbi:MAG: 1-acyl-sn-glycerol-3-phosphate acyltransferase [Polyangiaceae bacterium]|nr:1-acyl-sn-glycerol-3-phosphate acyltransferase [Polyangiaceae bacterium]